MFSDAAGFTPTSTEICGTHFSGVGNHFDWSGLFYASKSFATLNKTQQVLVVLLLTFYLMNAHDPGLSLTYFRSRLPDKRIIQGQSARAVASSSVNPVRRSAWSVRPEATGCSLG